MKEVAASRFKAECLALLDHVNATGEELVVTKRGRPVARVAPIDAPKGLRGSVEFLVDDDELSAPLDAQWDAARR